MDLPHPTLARDCVCISQLLPLVSDVVSMQYSSNFVRTVSLI